MKNMRFGVIGCGLMGREFASAASRWLHLPEMDVRPEITAICDVSQGAATTGWLTDNLPNVSQVTNDYRAVLANPDVEAVYIAVPHNLHERMYCDAIAAGKHLMGEKPFGIDRKANKAIMASVREHPQSFVRCSSEFPFYPAVQQIGRMIEADVFGEIIEVNSAFMHSSDLDPNKPINWKRMVEFNGEYGCMGDLGMHACHMPFRAGWIPVNVRAILSNIVSERPDGKGRKVACETWDNAILLCEAQAGDCGSRFPLTIKTQRISPGRKNAWCLEILGTRASARFTTENANVLEVLDYKGGEQAWQRIQVGHAPAFKSITGAIFEFGFSDAILQMWAAFLYELEHGAPKELFAGCVKPEETALSHRLFSAALLSQKEDRVVEV